MIALAKSASEAEIKHAANYFASVKPRQWIPVAENDTVPKTFIGPGNKRLVHPSGGTEPMGNRIIEVPENEEDVVYRDPRSGFVADVLKGSIAKGEALATTGGGKTTACRTCHGATLQGVGDVPGIAAAIPTTSSPDVEHPERRPHRPLGGPHAPGGGQAEQRRHAGDRSLCGVAGAVTHRRRGILCRSWNLAGANSPPP